MDKTIIREPANKSTIFISLADMKHIHMSQKQYDYTPMNILKKGCFGRRPPCEDRWRIALKPDSCEDENWSDNDTDALPNATHFITEQTSSVGSCQKPTERKRAFEARVLARGEQQLMDIVFKMRTKTNLPI